jgi:uncharacterized membrane protein
MHIRNPVEWGVDQLRLAGHAVESVGRAGRRARELHMPAPAVRRIGVAEIRDALVQGVEDFAAFRTDVGFLCVVYPLVGLVLARLAFGYDMLPLVFPLASGFALIGPFAAVGLYEMSRRRERGEGVSWAEAFGVLRSPSLGAIILLGLSLMAIFLLWLGAAMTIYDLLFALVAMSISVVSFPLLLDREVGFETAVRTSLRAVMANPGPMALWGLIVAAALVLGSIPLFLGLIVVMPTLGHATWHLYRKVVPR